MLLVLFPAFNLYSQKALNTEELFPELRYSELSGEIYHLSSIQTLGSAYSDDNYLIGNIFLQNGKHIENVKLKFNLQTNDLIVYQEIIHQLVIIDKYTVKGFELINKSGTEKYSRVQDLTDKDFSKYGTYVRVLYDGSISFYKFRYKEKVNFQTPSNSYLYKYDDKTDYYLRLSGKEEKVKLRHSTLNKLFPAYKSEIAKFVHSSRVKPRSEEGFVKIVEYIDSLH
jgi:hypothetical protein